MDELVLPNSRVDAAGGEQCYVVRGARVGNFVDLELACYTRHARHLRPEHLELESAIGLERFKASDMAGWSEYGGQLDEVARYAARGEFGHFVAVDIVDGAIQVELVRRELAEKQLTTVILKQEQFAHPESTQTLVASNECAAGLRAEASALNASAASERQRQYEQRRAEFDVADVGAREASELAAIVRAEGSDSKAQEL